MKDKLLKADKNARQRDFKNAKENIVDLTVVDKEELKANITGHTIVKKKDMNKATFSQIIQDNMLYLISKDYLTNAELGFMMKLSAMIELHSNAIVLYERDSDTGNYINTGQYLKVADIARICGYSPESFHVSRLVNSLIRKGILYELVDTQSLREHKGKIVKERPLFFNPEIIFAGDRNYINATLSRIVINADHLEKAKIKLPWKLWLKQGAKYGRLYQRKTYLKYKKKREKIVKK